MKIAFLDRDGIFNYDKEYVHKIDDFKWIDGIFELLDGLHKRGFVLVVITNQSGIGRGYYTFTDFCRLCDYMQHIIYDKLGFNIDMIYFCPHHPLDNCPCRKPGIGMIQEAITDFPRARLHDCILVGDKITDIIAARNAGIQKRFLLGYDPNMHDGEYSITRLNEILTLL